MNLNHLLVPRIVIVEANSEGPFDDELGQMYFAFLLDLKLLCKWQNFAYDADPTRPDDYKVKLKGSWRDLQFAPIGVELAFEFFDNGISICDKRYETIPVHADQMARVFRGLPKPYIVLGSRRFVRWARARVVSEMKSQSPIYRRIAQALAVN